MVVRGPDETRVAAMRCGFEDGSVQNPFHDRPFFNTGDHFDGAAALFTGFDIDLEYPFEALS